jgi:hypothetical protein
VHLGTRTVFATIPHYIFTFGNDATASLPTFLAVPVQLVVNSLYVVTNVPAQIVARLTGVTGASIFPLRPPAPVDIPPVTDLILLESAIAV